MLSIKWHAGSYISRDLIEPRSQPFSTILRRLALFRSGRRPVVWQTLLNMRKRLKGPPHGGQVSIVVTDIQGEPP